MSRNFGLLFEAGHSPYFMYLADDDRLSDDFLERCVKVLDDRQDVVLAGGVALRTVMGRRLNDARFPAPSLMQDSGARRVLGFIRARGKAAYFHGVRRTWATERAGPLRNHYGTDDQQMASMAYLGKVVVVPGPYYYKNFDVAPTLQDHGRKLQLSGLRARHPVLAYVSAGIADMGWRRRAYEEMSLGGRLALALASMTLWLLNRLWTRHVRPSARRAKRRARRRLRSAAVRTRRRLRRLVKRRFRRVRQVRRSVRRLVRRAPRRTFRSVVALSKRVRRGRSS
jgi:hypothetical protein